VTVDFSASLDALYATFGESATIAGSPITAIYDGGHVEALGVIGTQPSLRCRAADVSAIAVGAAVELDPLLHAIVSYTVRERQVLPPDELEVRLILERA
jgi:hypothetical protein